ncbi:baseplate J/gp47 family protein [Sphingomonas sp. AR_OL41]|uniref:baseplate J/gp47 family protein n=1 Tax=Sphingomonas sp. AR_OL41 TaxID=3042729 RepID=UPI0024809640|nr:baseplate J/gp47 family protein [Sphingomonas sp. AR_OL41]MDH7971794.1 baseplate J/gp47 family protein [Sphingomonas sp. AR_OL41]
MTQLIERAQGDIDARLPGADSRLRRNTLDVLARVHAGAMSGAYGMLDDISRFLPDVAESDRLRRWCSIFGIVPKAAVSATGTVTLTGNDDLTAGAGTILTRADGGRYVITADSTIAGTTATASVTAEGEGMAGAMDAGQSLTFLSPVAGIAAICTVDAPGLIGGVDDESDDALRARLLLRLRSPIRGGAASDYVSWARDVAEVTRAWVYENWDGLGTVKVLFVMDGRDDIIPTSDDVTLVATHIDPLRPVCAEVTVAAPIATALDLTIHPVPDSADIRAAITAELSDLISREAEPGGTILISHIREAISIAAGETDHTLTTPSANVTVSAGHISTLGTITWS